MGEPFVFFSLSHWLDFSLTPPLMIDITVEHSPSFLLIVLRKT
jgi:hypothetical protein